MAGKYSAFSSDFLSYTIDNEKGKIAFFGVESGGRDRDKHASYNLTIPSYGGVFGAFKRALPVNSQITEEYAYFENKNSQSAKYVFENAHTLNVEMDKPLAQDIFSVKWSIKTAPPTIWTKNQPKRVKCKNPLVIYKNRYELPMIVHFPDFGRVEITATSPDVFCVEELQLSRDFTGLDLGYLNHSFNHNRIHALHYGCSYITFKSKNPLERVGLKFRVMEECYPPLPDESDPRFNGLKRNFINSFALNRELFDMGDNIYFHGTGHLAIHMKSDMLQIVKEGDEYFNTVRRVYERQVERSFKDAQGECGEVSVCYYNNKDRKQSGNCSCDSTPGAIIGLCGISNWNLPFAKKYISHAIKAADFLLTFDTEGSGIFVLPFPGDYMGQKSEVYYGNWWDNFAFGHKDIYFNYLCHRALRELSALLRKVGKNKEAEKYENHLKKFDENFFETFYNKETELMAGWISKNGEIHDYGFTFAVSMGINEGLIPKDIGKKMLKKLLAIMKKEGYGDLRFGIPGNVMPVAQKDTIDWACMSDWGRYENGGLNGMNGFHFLTAMYNVGMNKEADDILFAILNTYEKEMTHSGLMPGYCQSIDWRTKEGVSCGYNYLADNYYFLMSVYAGKYKMEHPAVVR
ncbi:MAG: hypothetical protein J6B45_05170 [Clostridia bacterium]|nr:hypothetical protein [Clostridia bacterium]